MYAGSPSRHFERAAADRLVVEVGHHEQPGGWTHVRDVWEQAHGSIEPSVEAGVELGEVGPQARLSLGAGGIDDVDAHESRSEEAIDASHRRHEISSLPRRQRRQQRGGEGVAAPVEQPPFGATADGQAGDPDAAILLAGDDIDEPFAFQFP